MDNRPIGVFDSGLGGLTGVRQLRKILPNENIVYFGDTGRVPYGSRSPETIVQYAQQDINFLLSKNVKFIMAACGTVSSTYPLVRAANLPVPYTGVVGSTVRAALAATHNRRIGVIGTAATIRSGSYDSLLRQMLPGVEIHRQACPLFVPLVENGMVGMEEEITHLAVARYLTDIRNAGVDTLIMGCTHYPLLREHIQTFMGPDVALIDPGKVTATAIKEALEALDLLADPARKKGCAEFFVSDTIEAFTSSAELFLGEYAGGRVKRIAIETYGKES